MRDFRDAEWEDVERLRALGERVQYAEQIGETFSCESADDLPRIARYAFSCGISNRDVALLRYYAERIECENGAATELDHAIAKALLALHDGATPADTLSAVNDAIRAWEHPRAPLSEDEQTTPPSDPLDDAALAYALAALGFDVKVDQ